MNSLKNYLRTHRKRLGLSQRQLAVILGIRSPQRISDMELGRTIPSARECVAFRRLFKASFEELWPRVMFEVEATVDSNTRRLVEFLEAEPARSGRIQMRCEITCANLRKCLDVESDEESTNAA